MAGPRKSSFQPMLKAVPETTFIPGKLQSNEWTSAAQNVGSAYSRRAEIPGVLCVKGIPR